MVANFKPFRVRKIEEEKTNMKGMHDSNNDDGNNHNGSWLGFSLSPQIKMDLSSSSSSSSAAPFHFQQHQQQSHPSPSPTSFYLSPSHLSNSGICYGVGENGNFHSPLTVMPLKSDGSLCIMEALTRSQTQVMVPASPPKLEDFLGGATTMAPHEYGAHERGAMALSLDSIYYNTQNVEAQNIRDHSLFSETLRQQQQGHNNINLQSHPYYSTLCSSGIYGATLQEQETKGPRQQVCSSQMAQMNEEEEGLKNWVFQKEYTMEEQMNSEVGNDRVCAGTGGCGGELQSLSLSMSPGSQSSCVTAPSVTESGVAVDAKKRSHAKLGQKQTVHRKSIDTFGQRTSQYRGVTRHRWTGRYEAHLWDNSCKKEGQTRKGRQVYLGGYDMEEKAARAYDLAALKYWGPSTHINFSLENYQSELEEMKNMSRQEYVAHLRRKSSGFSRGASMYRGVTRHHQHGRWQARIGRVAGNKDLYLGTFSTQEEAAEAYDVAAIKFRGVNAVTNFDISRYDVERIMASNTLLAGELARRNKDNDPRTEAIDYNSSKTTQQTDVDGVQARNNDKDSEWKMALYNHNQQQSNNNNDNEVCKEKMTNNCASYKNSAFCVALQDLVGIDSAQQHMVNESSKIGCHFSNPSSHVTSLSSSREPSASPDKMLPSLLFPKPPTTEAKMVSSWFPAPPLHMRPPPAIALSHMPVFAAWNDT